MAFRVARNFPAVAMIAALRIVPLPGRPSLIDHGPERPPLLRETGAGLASASIDLTTLRQLRNESEGNAWCGVKPSVYGNQPCIHGDRFGQLDRLRDAIFHSPARPRH